MITEYRKPEMLAPGKVTVKDYDFDAPDKNLKVEQNTILKHGGASNRAGFPLARADARHGHGARTARAGAWRRRRRRFP